MSGTSKSSKNIAASHQKNCLSIQRNKNHTGLRLQIYIYIFQGNMDNQYDYYKSSSSYDETYTGLSDYFPTTYKYKRVSTYNML